MKKMRSIILPVSVFGIGLLASPTIGEPCTRSGPIVLNETCKRAEFIVRATAVKYVQEPKDPNIFTTGTPDSKISFAILEVLKGKTVPSTITLNGYLSNQDDFNDHPVPYNFVRPNGRRGSCYANTYKEAAEYLLFLKKRQTGFSVEVDALAPVNEQLRSSNDAWVYYIKGLLKGLEDASKPSNK